MNTKINKIVDNETPALVLSLPDGVEIRQYKKKTTQGAQVVTLVFNYPNDVWVHTTKGGGYCKSDHGLDVAFDNLGYNPLGYNAGQNLPRNYYVGGNFYKCDEVVTNEK